MGSVVLGGVVMGWVVSLSQPRMEQYFNQMEKIIKERKTTSRIRFMLQDVLDLRRVTHSLTHSLTLQ